MYKTASLDLCARHLCQPEMEVGVREGDQNGMREAGKAQACMKEWALDRRHLSDLTPFELDKVYNSCSTQKRALIILSKANAYF